MKPYGKLVLLSPGLITYGVSTDKWKGVLKTVAPFQCLDTFHCLSFFAFVDVGGLYSFVAFLLLHALTHYYSCPAIWTVPVISAFWSTFAEVASIFMPV